MRTNINDAWRFVTDGRECDVALPFDAMLREKRDFRNPNKKQSGYFRGGVYTYRRELTFAEEDLSKDISVLFEGVYHNAKVYLNGFFLYENKYGFTDFEVDLSIAAKKGKNILEVIADNALVPSCRWYSGAGIYRDVTLMIEEKGVPKNVFVKTVSILPTTIEVTSKEKEAFDISIEDEEGKIIYQGKSGRIEIEGAHPWDEDHPYLYHLKVRESEDIDISFGIRQIELIPNKGLFINGKKTVLRGGCIHSDNGLLGSESYRESEFRKAAILKKAGFNALRMAHNPCSRHMLEACDKLGIYVLDEAFDGWYTPKEYHDSSRYFSEVYELVLNRMVNKDYNHPSVIMYSLGNEVSETTYKKGQDLLGEMNGIVKKIDDTRPTTCGINLLIDVYARMGLGIYKDKGDYKPAPLKDDKGKFREKRNGSAFFNYWVGKLGNLFHVLSKTKTADKIVRDLQGKTDVLGLNYGSGRYGKDKDIFVLGTETFIDELPFSMALIERCPNIIGDFVWAAWDYLGETLVGDYTYPSYAGLPLTAGSGAIDLLGNHTSEMEFMRVVWGKRKEPYIGLYPLNHLGERPKKSAWRNSHSIPSYNWKGYEDKRALVEVFSSGSYVEIYQNGTKVAEGKLERYRAYFHIRYIPGELVVKAFDENGRELSFSRLISGENTRLSAVLEQPYSDNPDLRYMPIRFEDEHGNVVPYIEEGVSVEIDGKGLELKGFGSSISKTDESYLATSFKSYRGRLLAIFKVNGKEKTKVRIKSESGYSAEVIYGG
ncbi:MAG: DUF4982 domain-containing protein [Bacilli bacterium]|nr:DUF4982 domain-containing protein [Bacilli bacterium]